MNEVFKHILAKVAIWKGDVNILYWRGGTTVVTRNAEPQQLLKKDNGQFLTTGFKLGQMRKLHHYISKDLVDQEMIPYLQQLNAMAGACSMFCCKGHMDEDLKTNQDGYIKFCVDPFTDQVIYKRWHEVRLWPECYAVETGGTKRGAVVYWLFRWSKKNPNNYKTFMERFLDRMTAWEKEANELYKAEKALRRAGK